MTTLTNERIESLASQPGVSRKAVENFLFTVGPVTRANVQGIVGNLMADARSYRWSQETIQAIRTGIMDALS